MTPEEFEKLRTQVADIQFKLDMVVKPDRYLFQRDIELLSGKKIRGFIYAGSVAANGTATVLPPGWTSSKTATGRYVITHGMNTTRFVVVPSADVTLSGAHVDMIANYHDATSTQFTVELFDASPLARDNAFSFIVVRT
jgi:hypothetical protein